MLGDIGGTMEMAGHVIDFMAPKYAAHLFSVRIIALALTPQGLEQDVYDPPGTALSYQYYLFYQYYVLWPPVPPTSAPNPLFSYQYYHSATLLTVLFLYFPASTPPITLRVLHQHPWTSTTCTPLRAATARAVL
eukprot:3141394-Rhodomonas_salina.2